VSLPAATPNPCNDCPWRRKSARGWLGPYDADEWIALAHSDEPIACHETIDEDAVDDEGEADWNQPGLRQCRGAAIYRKNICKSPRSADVAIGPVDRETVFSNPMEFKNHHENA